MQVVSRLKAPSREGGGEGVEKSRPGIYNQVLNFGSPQTQGTVQSFWT